MFLCVYTYVKFSNQSVILTTLKHDLSVNYILLIYHFICDTNFY